MSVTCQFNGRLGNIIFNICQLVAYAKEHNLTYYIPTQAWACNGGVPSITIPSTGEQPVNPRIYNEPHNTQGHPYYHQIPAMDNVEFRGYYQSFLYFEQYRDQLLELFNLPHQTEYGVVGVSSRRTDCLGQKVPGTNIDAFPTVPREYYQKAIRYMQDKGYSHFRIYGDDVPWHKGEFTEENYPGATFEFAEGTELEDYKSLSQCEHSITARSTFSLTAGWMNRNSQKIILCPGMGVNGDWWFKINLDLLTGTESWLTQINW